MSNDKTIDNFTFRNLMYVYVKAYINSSWRHDDSVAAYKAVIAYVDEKLAIDAQAVRDEALEDAAKTVWDSDLDDSGYLVDAIRALKSSPAQPVAPQDHIPDSTKMVSDSGMFGLDRAGWLADKLCNGGDYSKEAAVVLVNQAKEIERLNSAIKWEQNRSGRIGTHGDDCHTWGHQHYECLLRKFNELNEAAIAQSKEPV